MAKGDIISRLKLESGEFDAKIKRAGQELLAYSDHCKKVGLQMGFANRDAKEFARQLGSMGTTSNTARGKINELSEAFVNLKVMYKNMTDEEKKGEFGRILSTSLDQLKVRLNDAKKDLSDVQKELGGESSSNGLNGALSTLASKMGVSGDLMGMLTTGTIGYTAAIGAAATAVAYATQQWAAFNSELAKQQQITSVTTGLKGDDADRMTAAARAVSKVYGTDFREVINAANTLMSQFGQTGDEAIQLIKDGMQGMVMGDGPKLLSMIQQYAPAFQSAGVSAKQLIAVIQNSEGGIFTDQNMQAIVMGISRLREMTNSTAEALRGIGINADEMKQKMEDGSMSAFEALQAVGQAIEDNKSKTNEVGVVMSAVFGRQGKMAGDNLGRAIAELNTNLEETKTQTGEVGESMKQLTEKTEDFESKLIQVFGLDGWETMNNEIKSGVLVSLTQTLDRLGDIFHMLNGISRIDMSTSGAAKFFMDLATYAYEALNPILGVLDAISQIYKYFNDGSGTGGNDDKLYNGGTIGDVVVTANRPRKQRTLTGGNGGRGGGGSQELDVMAANSKKITELSKQAITATDEERMAIREKIKALQDQNKEYQYYIDLVTGKIKQQEPIERGQGVGLGTVDNISKELSKPLDVSAIKTPLQSLEEELKNLIELQKLAWSPEQFAAYQSMIEKVQGEIGAFKGISKDGKETGKSWKEAASAISSAGSSLQQLEDPSAKIVGIIGQAIANIALGFAQATASDSKFGVFGWIAAIAGGLATMTSTIAAIHSATGYAQGGMIKGNSYSGDNIGGLVDGNQFVGLNAGEVVLNASQQSMLANNLQNNGGGSVHVIGHLEGETIVMAADRWGRRTGKGELLFGKNL